VPVDAQPLWSRIGNSGPEWNPCVCNSLHMNAYETVDPTQSQNGFINLRARKLKSKNQKKTNETTTTAWELCLAQSTKWVPGREQQQHKPELKAHAAHAAPVPSSISCTSTPQKTEALSAPEKANVQQVPEHPHL
jgi:hypothetical protein